jgi:tetratricopeptide (TPR) repeat protein
VVLELDENLQKANELAHQAWLASESEKRIRLAQQALELSPECVEACLVLAEEAEQVEEALEFCQKGVQAGERILGEDFLAHNEGHLWAIRQARPYLYIRHMLAECLALLGEEEAALEHCMALLRLNPDDHQGVRYGALGLLLGLGLDEQAEALLEEYDEDESTTWPYSNALVAFRLHGNSAPARSGLKKALAFNPYVIPYLVGEKGLPAEPPEAIGVGDDSEAMYYVTKHYTYWWATPGAIDWLKKYTRKERTG